MHEQKCAAYARLQICQQQNKWQRVEKYHSSYHSYTTKDEKEGPKVLAKWSSVNRSRLSWIIPYAWIINGFCWASTDLACQMARWAKKYPLKLWNLGCRVEGVSESSPSCFMWARTVRALKKAAVIGAFVMIVIAVCFVLENSRYRKTWHNKCLSSHMLFF